MVKVGRGTLLLLGFLFLTTLSPLLLRLLLEVGSDLLAIRDVLTVGLNQDVVAALPPSVRIRYQIVRRIQRRMGHLIGI